MVVNFRPARRCRCSNPAPTHHFPSSTDPIRRERPGGMPARPAGKKITGVIPQPGRCQRPGIPQNRRVVASKRRWQKEAVAAR